MSNSRFEQEIAAWVEREFIARKYGSAELADCATVLVRKYQELLAAEAQEEPEPLTRARRLRRTLEASEQHRTMCVEHGLNDSAIDVTYEIQNIEKQLVELVKGLAVEKD